MDLGLRGRAVLVTGGSAGIGLATVRLLLDEGACVATCARDAGRLEQVLDAEDIRHPDRLLLVGADVRDADQVGTMLAAVSTTFGRLDAVVNNAGAGRRGRVLETAPADWKAEFDMKILPVVNTVTAALPLLERSDQARIVNLNAVLSRLPDPRMAATGAARAALRNLTRSLVTELAPRGINVNIVSVGLVDTGRLDVRRREEGSLAPRTDFVTAEVAQRGILLGRPAAAGEVAETIVFLLSSRAAYITGAEVDLSATGVGLQ
jgi:NAD(P)-dependent dehydrogenase (short-subunit alcohol dehydrogenase family)